MSPPRVACRLYADSVLKPLVAAGLRAVISFMRPGQDVSGALKDAVRRRLHVVIVIGEENERHRSITVNILHGPPQGIDDTDTDILTDILILKILILLY